MAVTQLHRSTQLKPGSAYRVITNDSTGKMTDAAAITAARALQSDANGIPEASAVTTTELSYVSGVTSAIQTQLGGKASTALDNLTGVAINTTLVSDTNNTDDLGTASINWKDVHAKQLISSTGLTLTSGTGTIVLNPTTVTDASAKRITNMADPTAAQDAATKFYVDSISAGLDPKASVRLATTAALSANTAAGSGVGKTLTADANGALSVDSVAVVVGNRILVKNETPASDNGIYTVTATGDGSNPYVLTRSTDQDGSPSSEVSGGNFTFVEQGTLNNGTGWVVVADGDIVVDTGSINWTQFSETGTVTYVAGAGMTQSGTGTVTFDVVSANTGITVNANDLALTLNSTSGLEISTGLRIKKDTVTANTIGTTITTDGAGMLFDANSFTDSGSETLALAAGVAGSGLALTSGVLSVNVDDSTIEINSDTLRVKDLGITTAKLAAGAVTYAKTSMVTREVPSGTIDGANAAFTLAFTPATAGSEHVYRNGILQNGSSNDYAISGDTITFTAGSIPQTGDVVLVSYWK